MLHWPTDPNTLQIRFTEQKNFSYTLITESLKPSNWRDMFGNFQSDGINVIRLSLNFKHSNFSCSHFFNADSEYLVRLLKFRFFSRWSPELSNQYGYFWDLIDIKSWRNLQMTTDLIFPSYFRNSSFDPKQSFLIWDEVEKSDDNRTTVSSWFPTVSHWTIQQLGHGLNVMNIWYVQTITWPNLIMGLERPFETEFSSFVILRHTQAVNHFGRILKK